MKNTKIRLKKGDQVKVIAGKDKGKTGKILKIDRSGQRVIVEGLNIVKKTMRPKKEGDKGDIIEIESPLSVSNVMAVCRKCGPTRIGYKTDAKGKPRICKKCGETL
jgi:large subunit ribosomal protein L24